MLNNYYETERLLGGDGTPVRFHHGTNSLVVYVLNENLLFGLLFFPKAFQQLGCLAKLIEWWWRLVATIFAFSVSMLLLTVPIVFEMKEYQNFLLLELEVSVATLVIYELFCVFRDHYLLLTFDIPGWLGSLKIIFLDAGLPMLIIGSFVFSIKIFLSWNTSNSGNELVANSTLAQWLSTLAMTFFMQTLWCICYFMWLYCRSGKVKLSVSYLITSEDSPIFLTNDGTDQESTCRKVKRFLCSLGYVTLGVGLVVTAFIFIYHPSKAQNSK